MTRFVSLIARIGLCLTAAACSVPVSTDPNAGNYRNPAADFARYPTVVLNFVSVTTNDGTDVEYVRSVFHESLHRHMRRGFDQVVDGDIARPGQLRVDINLRTWWLDRVAAWRGVVVLPETGKGMPGMVAEYVVKGANDEVLARFTRADVEAFAYLRNESRSFVKEYAEKWNESFVRELLGGTRP